MGGPEWANGRLTGMASTRLIFNVTLSRSGRTAAAHPDESWTNLSSFPGGGSKQGAAGFADASVVRSLDTCARRVGRLWSMTVERAKANKQAIKRMIEYEPVLLDIQRALDVVPGMKANMLLTSGAPLPWSEITGIQRRAVIQGVLYEGLAQTYEEAEAKLDAGEIPVEPTQVHGCIGAATGVYTASMPVYVVENKTAGNRAYCNLVEGNPPRLFAYAAWGEDVHERMTFVRDVLAPVMGQAIRNAGGIALKPIMRRALAMGDDLHTRNDAATQLFAAALVPHFFDIAKEREDDVRRVFHFLQTTPFMFMRIGIAAAKTALDWAHGIEGSSVVTGMIHSAKEFSIRVSGLGDQWFGGPHLEFQGKLFWGNSYEDIGWAGGESSVMETMGLGGFAQAAAFALPFRGTIEETVERNRRMYDITVGENPEFKIPYFERGIPTGIDLFKVLETGYGPVINGAAIRKDGDGAAGVGPLVAKLDVFETAMAAYKERYGA